MTESIHPYEQAFWVVLVLAAAIFAWWCATMPLPAPPKPLPTQATLERSERTYRTIARPERIPPPPGADEIGRMMQNIEIIDTGDAR